MTTGTLLLSLALVLLVGLFVFRPFLLPNQRPPRLSERQVLQAEKEALLEQIRALDFDAQTGKQDRETYEAERSHLLSLAADVLERLDEAEVLDVDAQIEAAVARLRQGPRTTKEGHFCPSCGAAVLETDKFCANCGENLA